MRDMHILLERKQVFDKTFFIVDVAGVADRQTSENKPLVS